MLKKLMIRTWRGSLPIWTPQFRAAVSHLSQTGWDFMIVDDWDSFRLRVVKRLGIQIHDDIDTRKPGGYDPALGVVYEDLLSGYDFWGHFNLDCVYGRLHRFLPDDFLANIDIYGNDPGAICGPFSVYRNTEKINNLFRDTPRQKESFRSRVFDGWDELEFSEFVKGSTLNGYVKFVSGFLQAHDHMTHKHLDLANINSNIPPCSWREEGDVTPALIDNVTNREIMMYHFNYSRRWPVGEYAK